MATYCVFDHCGGEHIKISTLMLPSPAEKQIYGPQGQKSLSWQGRLPGRRWGVARAQAGHSNGPHGLKQEPRSGEGDVCRAQGQHLSRERVQGTDSTAGTAGGRAEVSSVHASELGRCLLGEG